MKLKKTCKECGVAFTTQRTTAAFCSDAHRNAFNHRRRDRGAELYDLIMGSDAHRLLCEEGPEPLRRVLTAYHEADTTLRGGRASWQDYNKAVLDIPMVYGKEGDKR